MAHFEATRPCIARGADSACRASPYARKSVSGLPPDQYRQNIWDSFPELQASAATPAVHPDHKTQG